MVNHSKIAMKCVDLKPDAFNPLMLTVAKSSLPVVWNLKGDKKSSKIFQ